MSDTANAGRLTGGCQCGAVRFRAERLGRGAICHCRMCQKAVGSFYAPFVSAYGLTWTRGAPKHFQSSNKVSRGFCGNCGTPLTYEGVSREFIDVAIGALDDPTVAAPVLQVNPNDKLPFVDELPGLRMRAPGDEPERDAFYESLVSYQHPDHDTSDWRPVQGRHQGTVTS